MVYLPSNGHIVTLGSTRNIQWPYTKSVITLRVDLLSNIMEREYTSRVMCLIDTQLPCAIQTEPVKANSLDVKCWINNYKQI